MAGTAVWAYALLGRATDWNPWLRPLVLALGLLTAIGLAAGRWLSHRVLVAVAAGAVVACLAGPTAWAISTANTPHTGSIVTAGATSGDEVKMDITYAFVKQIRVFGSRLGTIQDLSEAVQHLNNGYFKPLICQMLPLEEIVRAHELMESRDIIGKLIIRL